jgi:hypothetical protein
MIGEEIIKNNDKAGKENMTEVEKKQVHLKYCDLK